MDPLLPLFHPRDPYTGHNTADHPQDDLQGWNADSPVFSRLLREVRPDLIVEVGSWKGASAINMAREASLISLQTQIICIDTWLGSPEHNLGLMRDSLRPKNGYPQLYYTFLNNVILAKGQKVIIPLPQTSQNGAEILRRLALHPALIYLDAAHEHDPAYADLRAFWPLLRPGGILFGDDYHPNWPGIISAADNFALHNNIPIEIQDEKFILRKPGLAPGLAPPPIPI